MGRGILILSTRAGRRGKIRMVHGKHSLEVFGQVVQSKFIDQKNHLVDPHLYPSMYSQIRVPVFFGQTFFFLSQLTIQFVLFNLSGSVGLFPGSMNLNGLEAV